MYDYIILGAGPTGLTIAHVLKSKGINNFIILEKESEAGGLCRSKEVDGKPLDIGGGHFLDAKNKIATEFLFKFLPEEEWLKYSRISNIIYNDQEMGYPFESHIWQLPIDVQVEFIDSIYKAGCNNNQDMPQDFESWIRWKLGKKIAEEYMLPYNKKIWSIPLKELGTYWLYKLPNVSTKETIKSCLARSLQGKVPAHAHFYYPKTYGYGEVWKRMAKQLGDKIIYNYPVKKIDASNKSIDSNFNYNNLIVTIPWTRLEIENCPDLIKNDINQLKHSSIKVGYHSKDLKSNAHWLYIPDENIEYHRILNRRTFVPGSKGYWTETNTLRSNFKAEFEYNNEFAYPLNTINKPQYINDILEWARSQDIYGVGRWGEWEHMNSDIAVQNAISNINDLLNKKY